MQPFRHEMLHTLLATGDTDRLRVRLAKSPISCMLNSLCGQQYFRVRPSCPSHLLHVEVHWCSDSSMYTFVSCCLFDDLRVRSESCKSGNAFVRSVFRGLWNHGPRLRCLPRLSLSRIPRVNTLQIIFTSNFNAPVSTDLESSITAVQSPTSQKWVVLVSTTTEEDPKGFFYNIWNHGAYAELAYAAMSLWDVDLESLETYQS